MITTLVTVARVLATVACAHIYSPVNIEGRAYCEERRRLMAIYLVYPEKRWVENQEIETWYLDAIDNSLIKMGQAKARNVDEMAEVLEDIGIITRGKPPHKPVRNRE